MADTVVTMQTIINNSIARAKDPDKTQWSDAQMLIFGNKAIGHIHNLLININSDLAITAGTITMATLTQEYNLASNLSDFFGMVENGVYFSAIGEPLTPCTYEDKIRCKSTTTALYPIAYYLTPTSLGVLNIPTAVSAAAYPTLNCRYYKRHTDLALADTMPYKNLLNGPISAFMDHMAILKTTAPTEEYTALFNALEEATLFIVKKRIPL